MSGDGHDLRRIVEDSNALASDLHGVIRLPLANDSERVRVSDLLCSLSLEHWHATRQLLGEGMLPSALTVHRAQFEAIVRSIWVLYGASNHDVSRLNQVKLSAESEQVAKNLPQTHKMMEVLEHKAPSAAYAALERFKSNSWKALNSYAHAGIHPVRRHETGYPIMLVVSALLNANGLAVVSCMQAVALSGAQPLQRAVLNVAGRYPHCLPPPL